MRSLLKWTRTEFIMILLALSPPFKWEDWSPLLLESFAGIERNGSYISLFCTC